MAVPAVVKGLEKGLLDPGEVLDFGVGASRLRFEAIEHRALPHHNLHAGFDQLLSGLKLFVETIHAGVGAIRPFFGAIHALIGAIRPLFGSGHAELKELLFPFSPFQALNRALIQLIKLRLELSVSFLCLRIHSFVF